jgi:uncharacterized protein
MMKKPDGVERRTTFDASLEVRDADGMTFTGYAAVFDSDSQPLPFTERIAPGAFRSTLRSRNRVMLLANHNPEKPLASTRSGTLRLAEDDRGLRAEATLPNTTTGRDVAELLRTGVLENMSIGFTTVRDAWDGNEKRVLHEVALHEVSIVTWAAYEATTAAIRSVDVLADATGEDAAALSDLLDAVATGTLNADQKRLLMQVADKIGPADVVEIVAEEPAVPLDVLKAQIDLLGKDI